MNKTKNINKSVGITQKYILNMINFKIKFLRILIIFTFFLLAYFPVWKRLVMTWYGSDDYSHGFFIVPLCLYIIWQKREILAKIPKNQTNWGLFWVLFSLLIYLIANFAEIVTMSSLSMVLFLAGLILYFYGFLMLKELIFPLAFLVFMIPVPAQIYATLTIPLQLFVSAISTWIASIVGVPVYREGNVINLPEHTLQVVQACSGLRSMISLLTLSTVFGYLTLKSNVLRTILVFSGIPAAIAVNIIRVVGMVIAYYYFDYDLAQGSVHTVFGIFIFILALIIIAGVKGVLSIWDKSATLK
jgi:exosortase